MIDQLLNEIEAAKASLAEWQHKKREAHEQELLGRGYLQALVKALEMVQASQAQMTLQPTDESAKQ